MRTNKKDLKAVPPQKNKPGEQPPAADQAGESPENENPENTSGAMSQRQAYLPGTYAGIDDLDDVGLRLKAVRREIASLRVKETDLVDEAKNRLRKHNMSSYHYGEVDLEIVPGKERVSTAGPKDED